MERREVLALGGLFGVGMALGGGTGCLPSRWPKTLPDAEMSELLGKIDANLERVSRYDMLDDFARRSGTNTKYSDAEHALARASMRSLYMSATFRSLPEEAQMHPAMQERIIRQLPEMDDAVYGMTDRMATLDDERREHVRRALGEPRTEPEAISRLFDKGMGTLEMPTGRRFQMRSIFSQVGFRMQNQPDVIIDEYVRKVQKATEQIGSQVELQRRIAAQIGQDAYWKHQYRLALMLADDPGGMQGGAGSGATSGPPGATGAPVSPVAPVPPPVILPEDVAREVQVLLANAKLAAERGHCEAVVFLGKRIGELDPDTYRNVYLTDRNVIACRETLRNRRATEASVQNAPACDDPKALANQMARSKVIGTGGWMLGIGLITGLLSIAAVSAEAAIGLVGLTLGAGLVVGGLIVLIVGGGMASS